MRRFILIFYFLLPASLIFAQQISDDHTFDPDHLEKEYYSQVLGVNIDSCSNVNLYKAVHDWMGTPYRYAGKSKKGIDCSALLSKLYDDAYNVSLIGSSVTLFSQVEAIDKTELQEGDILFFKIRRGRISHVGIYLTGDKFAHASLSRGVTISDLNDPYYERYFYTAGRLKFPD